jgi:hypothetical protein
VILIPTTWYINSIISQTLQIGPIFRSLVKGYIIFHRIESICTLKYMEGATKITLVPAHYLELVVDYATTDI